MANGNGNGKPRSDEPKPEDKKTEVPQLDEQAKANADTAATNLEVVEADQQKKDPLKPSENMKAEQAFAASPTHMLLPDPLPPLDRPIFETPVMGVGHPPLELHPGRPSAQVEADIENFRTRLGELREFLKRFPHTLGGSLGDLVSHLRITLGVPVHDPIRDADRLQEDKHITERRRQEDIAAGGAPNAALQVRRAEEDAGRAAYRRIQDTPV